MTITGGMGLRDIYASVAENCPGARAELTEAGLEIRLSQVRGTRKWSVTRRVPYEAIDGGFANVVALEAQALALDWKLSGPDAPGQGG